METAIPLELLNNMPWVWLGIAVLMTIIEGLTMGLTTIWLAIAALVSMILAFFIVSIPAQIIVFLVISILLFVFTRPVAIKKMKLGSHKTNAESLVGKIGQVQVPVTKDNPGQVKVGGQIWTARPENPDETLGEGTKCRVVRIEGVTVIVEQENAGESSGES